MSRRKMIGAHVPQKQPKTRNGGRALAREFSAAYDNHFTKKPSRTHLTFSPAMMAHR